MDIFSAAKWIWLPIPVRKNQFAVFKGEFTVCDGAELYLAANTDYIAYVNGKRVSFGQFPGWQSEQYYDTVDISRYCTRGSNELRIAVRYEGVDSATHISGEAGLIFCVIGGGKTVLCSGSHIVGGLDTGYLQNEERNITFQLGLSVSMRNSPESVEFLPCRELERDCILLPRPVGKTAIGDFVAGERCFIDGHEIYDLGCERAGYLAISVRADKAACVKVAYGEHLADGCVRRKIGNRDFSLDFYCREGLNEFEQLFVRIAGRYLEVLCDDGVQVEKIGILPAYYPVATKPCPVSGADKDIYDICVRTLKLCMHEHYEDCPWREQALYALDSRNQMMCGYYAFENSRFARANLVFMSKGVRPDGLLELTYPAVNTPAIPFFSLIYPVALCEYVRHTGDASIWEETYKTAVGIMQAFAARVDDNGLIANFEQPYWNFYEWSRGSDGRSQEDISGNVKYDLILNCAYVYAVERMNELSALCGSGLRICADEVKNAVLRTFYCEDKGLFFASTEKRDLFTQLGNAFALLINSGDKRTAEAVKSCENMIPATLSTVGFVYDALLSADKDNRSFVLNDIRATYSAMLGCGATSVWETKLGQSDFDNAGSLCHGWSALPVYYYNILKEK